MVQLSWSSDFGHLGISKISSGFKHFPDFEHPDLGVEVKFQVPLGLLLVWAITVNLLLIGTICDGNLDTRGWLSDNMPKFNQIQKGPV